MDPDLIRMRHFLLFLLFVPFLTSCDEECRGLIVGKEFEIASNETLENCPKNISVTLLKIEDSRCPADLICIWGGMIVIEGKLKIEAEDFDLKLSTNQSASGFPGQFSTAEYTVKLIDVLPYPDSSNPDQSQAQRAILLISKRSN